MKIGILGNGQLGRMAALAAANLGIEVVIYAPDGQGPANQVVRNSHVGAYEDAEALKRFAAEVEFVTYEFENVPVKVAKFIEQVRHVYPQSIWLERAQHRMREKDFINGKGIATAPYTAWDPGLAGQKADRNVVLKTCSGGYDGKGQWVVKKGETYPDDLPEVELIVEDMIDLAGEVSVIICADQFGKIDCYDASFNEHKDGILRRSTVPAQVSQKEIVEIAHKLIKDEDFVGVLALELFLTKDGKILANEMAPRPHNSGHWTIDACACSQFEQQIRAVARLPLGSTQRHSDAEMLNLIGYDVEKVPEYMAEPSTAVHLYGKTDTKPGRKMGHITRIYKDKAH